MSKVERADVLRVELRGAEGQELAGPHYCVVVSSNDWNGQADQILVVVPLGSHRGRPKPRTYEIGLKAGDGDLPNDGVAIPRQVRTISTGRVTEIWGRLSDSTMIDIEDMLGWGLGLFEDDDE